MTNREPSAAEMLEQLRSEMLADEFEHGRLSYLNGNAIPVLVDHPEHDLFGAQLQSEWCNGWRQAEATPAANALAV